MGRFELQAVYYRSVPAETKGGPSKSQLGTVIIIPEMLQWPCITRCGISKPEQCQKVSVTGHLKSLGHQMYQVKLKKMSLFRLEMPWEGILLFTSKNAKIQMG